MFPSARRGVISLIPKENRDLLLVKSWRPICLLCVDFKIYSKVLANRLKGTLETLISNTQSGFMKGGDIAENVRKVLDVMEFTKTNNIEALIIQVDFEKAFDRVDYNALFDCMRYFGYGEEYIRMNTMLFKDMNLCTTNIGHLSNFWVPTRGLFQGNPIGPYLFLLVIETLAIKLKENPKIEGIVVEQLKMLLSQFADDLDMFVKYKKEVWQEIISTFGNFEQNSGMKINYDKTTVYRIGSLRNTQAMFYSDRKIRWSNGPINVLGVLVSYNHQEMLTLNLDPLVTKSENLLRMWKIRGLSLIGKVLVINSLVASLFSYRMNVIRKIPSSWFRKIKQIMLDFIWGGRSKIPWRIMTANREDGGCGLVDLEQKEIALKISWAFKAMRKEEIGNLASSLLNNKYANDIWKANLSYKEMHEMFDMDNFWGDVLIEWQKLQRKYLQKEGEVGDQTLWLNTKIKIGGKVVWWKDWIEAGIISWHDLTEDGKIYSWQRFSEIFPNLKSELKYNGMIAALNKK